ncbi:GLPGLI family protein [Chryseobacterium sp. CBSDS_008]|uniref:GLPGLI family protein n=1 Tax=Chryseobacterium sp. CBSDS_008 TaxID=3415265 RepID=UPI003CE95A61
MSSYKYKYLLVFLFVSSVFFSQQKKYSFGYRLKYVPDSTDTLNSKIEDFTLFVENGKSYFVSDNFLKRDSILNSIQKKQGIGFNFANTPNTRFRSVVIKDSGIKNISFYDNILKYYFSYQETPNFNWKLISEKKKIGDYSCSKAETVYAGRTWIAWYTTEISINEGPYKFNGLPGLIIQISDTKDDYNFELISIKKGNFPNDNTVFSENYLKKHKQLTKEEYLKVIKNINENIINEASMSGLTISPESVERAKANFNKRNNPIELNKL